MYPNVKFMNESDDLIFTPFEINSSLNNGLFVSEEFIEEFRTSSISENPLTFDFREIILSSNITNKEEELKELISLYENDPRLTKDILKCHNLYSEDLSSNLRSIPSECDILRELNLDINEEILELERDFEDVYELEARTPNTCNAEVIFNKMMRTNPRIMGVLTTYKIPFPVAKTLIKQIINFTIFNCNPSNNIKPFPDKPFIMDGNIIPMPFNTTIDSGENND